MPLVTAGNDSPFNRRGLIALVVVVILLFSSVAYLYLTNQPQNGETVASVMKEGDETGAVELTLDDLKSMEAVSGHSSYQNFFWNWRGEGDYVGVLVSDLVEKIEQIGPGDNITVHSTDGYNQTYCYENVYNDWPDPSIQGDMILAYEFNGTSIPEWTDGPMIVFLPEDGAYSNFDCLNTSCPGQGGNVYLSAGSRWVRNVERIVIEGPGTFQFVVMGDSQGNSGLLSTIVDEVNTLNVSFVLHTGDCVSHALEGMYDVFEQDIAMLEAPIHISPGNHDRMGNATIFQTRFGSGDYSFDYGGWRFVSVDTSTQDISESQFIWLRALLENSSSRPVVVFTHVPPFDPRIGEDHHLNETSDCEEFIALMEEFKVRVVVTGHVHLYNNTRIGSVDYVVTGGAGADLYAPHEEGGFHHFTLFSVDGNSISFSPVPVEADAPEGAVVVSGRDGSVSLSLEDLMEMPWIEGYSSYQNFYGNWKGHGTYRGVLLSDLLALVGGIQEGDVIRVESSDGYYQEFCYWNIHPNETWYSAQGDMILAYEFNGTPVPDWENGFETAFLPEDGAYSNDDCLATSAEGQGGNVYLSAGSRWVKAVTKISVIAGQ